MSNLVIDGTEFRFSTADRKYVGQFELYVDDDGYLRKRGCTKRHPETRIHRLIARRMGLTIEGAIIDHKNRDRADNRRSNLRTVTAQQSALNRKKLDYKSSIYRGVSWRNDTNNWRARLTINGKNISVGSFPTEDEAHAAFLAAAKLHPDYHGEEVRIVD